MTTDHDEEFLPPQPVTWLQKLAIGLIGAALLLAIGMSLAHAQTACTAGGATTCFVASKTTGEAPLSTTLTWNVIGASACTAGNTPGWTGSVPTSGTRTLTSVNVKLTLTLDCTAPATAGKMRLSWTPPTQNTNGSALTNLGGYFLDYGTSAVALNQSITLAVPGANTFDITGLTAGTWFASIRAATTGCFPATTVTCAVSAPSNVASLAVTTTPGGALPQLSLVLEPYTVPKAPTGLVVTEVTAFRIDENADGTLQATRVALLPLSTSCVDDRCTVVTKLQ